MQRHGMSAVMAAALAGMFGGVIEEKNPPPAEAAPSPPGGEGGGTRSAKTAPRGNIEPVSGRKQGHARSHRRGRRAGSYLRRVSLDMKFARGDITAEQRFHRLNP